ncbi:MAG: cation transporter [Deltaproteobacteria bacterium]|nr:cation transporter [Deltaproteobacteria bacterium]
MTSKGRQLEGAGPRPWSAAAGIGSIAAAFLASICCVGPLLFALLGIGGAGLLVTLAPYRPYLIVATAALLGTSFYLTYRRPRSAPAPGNASAGCACPTPRASRAGKVLLWLATVVVAGLLAFPYAVESLATGGEGEPPSARALPTDATSVLAVEGMTCASCAVAVAAALEALDGVHDARVSVPDHRAVVLYDPATITPRQLVVAVDDLGYSAAVVPRSP